VDTSVHNPAHRGGMLAGGRLDNVACGTSDPEQRPPSLCLYWRHERARQPRSQLPTTVERCAEQGPTGHSGGRKPINAKCETVRTLPTFRDAYRLRRCIVPVDGFFEWKAMKGHKAKRPYAIAMKDGKPFGILARG
jgi:hypothetical protein